MTTRELVARLDGSMHAQLDHAIALTYEGGGSPSDDRPSHVRAASGLQRWNGRLAVVQDDVNVIALLEPQTAGGASFVLLPPGEGGLRVFGDERRNKHAKMDLEACTALPDGRLVALGSGSLAARERLVVLDDAGRVRLVDGAALYAQLRRVDFAGSELNVEGAVVVGDRLRLFQRGNGAPRGDLRPVNATCDLPLDAFVRWLDADGPLPAVENVLRFDLGAAGDVPLGFTDATVLDDGRVAFLACAEASPDAVRDGDVVGCRFGIIDGDDVRTTDVLEADGRPTLLKLEGLESRGPDGQLVVVADMDRPDEPGRLILLHVRGA